MPQAKNSQPPLLRLVPDTGFYIAAALQDGYARSYLVGHGTKFLSYQLYTSEAILLELQQTLENKFMFERPRVVDMISQIRGVVNIIHPTIKLEVVRDPRDDMVLECAVEAKADAVITFDKDLLDIKNYDGIAMVHPSQLKYWFPRSDKQA